MKKRFLVINCLIVVAAGLLISCNTKTVNARSTISLGNKEETVNAASESTDQSVTTKTEVQPAKEQKSIQHNQFAFDCHLHVLQINHVAWSAYISYVEKNPLEQSLNVMSAQDYLFKDFFQTTRSSRNLLAVMERSAGDILELYENDLRGKYEVTTTKIEADPLTLSIKDAFKTTQESITGSTIIEARQKIELPFIRDEGITMMGNTYSYLVISPLIMDFDLRDTVLNTYYKDSPAHEVEAQGYDILEGIYDYRTKNPDGRLIIRPFMGINPSNWNKEDLSDFLDRYFGAWSGNADEVLSVWNKITENKLIKGRPYANAFAGIKLYPPLDFNPFPSNPDEWEKLDYLYTFCEDRGIPIITHCDDQGFRVVSQSASYEWTSPEQWEKVLARHPNLYLDIAHFGNQYTVTNLRRKQTVWRDKVIEMMLKYPNLYADVSFNGVDTSYWNDLQVLLNSLSPAVRDIVSQRLLFGTDWPLTLLKMESLTAYYRGFEQSSLGLDTKQKMISDNPRNFYFRD